MAVNRTYTKSKSEKKIVAAIDIGTTCSGYAWAEKRDFEADPPKINTFTNWIGGGILISCKTPTVLLLNRKQEFVAFGYEAEDKYSELAADGKHEDYFYFRNFIMNIIRQRHLKREIVIKDEHSKTMCAMKVLSFCLKYLVDHCLRYIKLRVNAIDIHEDIQWVLTVPATSHDDYKQFMREAAQAAGLNMDVLTIALESETATQFCMHLPIENLAMTGSHQNNFDLSPFSVGQRIMVVDVGGHTVNTTVYEVVGVGKLKELISTSEGSCGAKLVDEAFEEFLNMIVGKIVFDKFKSSYPEDWVDIQRHFELKKRGIEPDKAGKETVLVPATLSATYKAMTKDELQTAVNEGTFAGKITWIAGKIRISRDIMREWYKDTCENTVKHIQELFKQGSCKGTDTIFLVGDFSESRMLQKALADAFPNKRFIVPEEAVLAVINGAVLYGHDPITIVSRVAKCSYGVLVFRDFIEGQHPKEKMEQCGDRLKCKDVFGKHITKGQDLVVGETQTSQRYIPSCADQESFVFDIYASPDTDPKFITDDGCTHIGRLEVEVPGSGKDRAVWVGMIYYGTEIIVLAKDEKTGKEAKTTLDFH